MKHTHTPWPVRQQKLLLLFEGVEKKWWCFVWIACVATWDSGKCLLCTLFSNLALNFRINSMHKNAEILGELFWPTQPVTMKNWFFSYFFLANTVHLLCILLFLQYSPSSPKLLP